MHLIPHDEPQHEDRHNRHMTELKDLVASAPPVHVQTELTVVDDDPRGLLDDLDVKDALTSVGVTSSTTSSSSSSSV